MDQLNSLSHTYYWYEVGTLKVPAILYCTYAQMVWVLGIVNYNYFHLRLDAFIFFNGRQLVTTVVNACCCTTLMSHSYRTHGPLQYGVSDGNVSLFIL